MPRTPSTAGAAGPPMSTRRSTSATSAATTAPTATAAARIRAWPPKRSACTARAEPRFACAHPVGSAEVRLPLPGLYNVYNALGAAALCLELGVGLETIVAGLGAVAAAFGRAETLDVDGREVSILLIKNPAGANEILRTLALEPGELDVLAILNDRTADGRDISWVWDADFELLAGRVARVVCAGTRAAELALRLKYAGVEPERLTVEHELPAALDQARGRAGLRAPVRAAHLHGAARAARGTRADAGTCPVLAARAGGQRVSVDLARPRVRRLPRGSPAVARSGPAPRRTRCSTSAPGPGASPIDLARQGHEVVALDRRSRAARRAGAAGRRAARSSTVVADARDFALGRRFALVSGADADRAAARRRGRRAPAFCAARASTCTAAGRIAVAIAETIEAYEVPDGALGPAARCARTRRGRVLQPADGDPGRRRRLRARAPARARERDGERTVHEDRIRLDRLDADTLEAEARAVGLRVAGRRLIDATDDHVGSTVVMLGA